MKKGSNTSFDNLSANLQRLILSHASHANAPALKQTSKAVRNVYKTTKKADHQNTASALKKMTKTARRQRNKNSYIKHDNVRRFVKNSKKSLHEGFLVKNMRNWAHIPGLVVYTGAARNVWTSLPAKNRKNAGKLMNAIDAYAKAHIAKNKPQ